MQGIYEAAYAISVRLQSRSPQKGSPASVEPGIDYASYQEPRDPVWNDARRVTEALLIQMRDEVKKRQAKFFVVTLSGSVQVLPDPTVRQEFMKKGDLGDLFYA